jgi:PhzF family phenazine biosynthesis protein
MKKFKFKKIDAFATQKSEGNSAGMVYLDSSDDITPDEMQRIANELKGFVNEVGYIRQRDEDTFDLRYFSSEREVDFCGHATIAIMYEVIKESDALMKQKRLNIRTAKGNLVVDNKIPTENAVFISSPDPVFSSAEISSTRIAAGLGINSDQINASYPVSVVNAGLETLIVPVRSLRGVLAISPVFDTLKKFCYENAVDIITVFATEVSDKEHTYRTRVFAPTYGYLEDPATGSGNSALGYYLIKNGLWDGALMSIEQNASLSHPNTIKLAAKKSENNDVHVMFGGGAITRIQGEYLLQ